MEKEFQDLFQIRHNDDRVEVGKVLIAEPFLEGKYFNRSVVYMVEHAPVAPWSVISCITSTGEMIYRTRKRSRREYIGEVTLRL